MLQRLLEPKLSPTRPFPNLRLRPSPGAGAPPQILGRGSAPSRSVDLRLRRATGLRLRTPAGRPGGARASAGPSAASACRGKGRAGRGSALGLEVSPKAPGRGFARARDPEPGLRPRLRAGTPP
ncbi:hypothetical protein GCM10009579_57480 [Streptomyces javensis]|uniref:Uncharacterized protein n=1 Tax=Streptomyces javensis TaxID=114698 RepID=A0ABP4HTL4_9ACTN